MILVVDVDDITITGNSPRAIKWFKDNLSSRYDMKDIQWLLGIGIERDREKRMISFSQTHMHISRRSLNASGWKRPNHC